MRSSKDPRQIASAALQAYFNITAQWGLDGTQERLLLGKPRSSTFDQWKATKSADRLDEILLERISYLMGIAKALHRLLPPESADDWIKKPNSAPLFNGRSALEKMLSGDMNDLAAVRRYLEAECG